MSHPEDSTNIEPTSHNPGRLERAKDWIVEGVTTDVRGKLGGIAYFGGVMGMLATLASAVVTDVKVASALNIKNGDEKICATQPCTTIKGVQMEGDMIANLQAMLRNRFPNIAIQAFIPVQVAAQTPPIPLITKKVDIKVTCAPDNEACKSEIGLKRSIL